MLALDAEQARGVPGGRPGRSALALTALSVAMAPALAACTSPPASVVTQAQAQIAKIAG